MKATRYINVEHDERQTLREPREEQLELMNGLYPRKPPPAGEFIKIVE